MQCKAVPPPYPPSGLCASGTHHDGGGRVERAVEVRCPRASLPLGMCRDSLWFAMSPATTRGCCTFSRAYSTFALSVAPPPALAALPAVDPAPPSLRPTQLEPLVAVLGDEVLINVPSAAQCDSAPPSLSCWVRRETWYLSAGNHYRGPATQGTVQRRVSPTPYGVAS